ncbi:recombinase RecT [Rhodococcus aetherivorans]|uniref:recombinase RecT n=1 Tax=Rhodococcus aetherivorans TaxID=191292 RepID=UPI0031D0CBE9
MTDNALSTAVATRDNSPRNMIAQYSNDFATVLPSHIKPDTWVRLAQGALKKGTRLQNGRTELEVAAANNPSVFMAALLDAARLGLEPGTAEYYLTPRKVKGKLEILGIVGYQGIIELIYRAGAVSSVVAECVYDNDTFRYQPGRDEVPDHQIDWDIKDRGKLRLVYAYARMRDGAVSKIVVLNKADIARIRKSSQGADSEYSPWTNHEASMWLKSAVRQLSKWVPTSAEYVREQLRAVRDVQAEGNTADRIQQDRTNGAVQVPIGDIDSIIDGDIIDAEPYDAAVESPVEEAGDAPSEVEKITDEQLKTMRKLLANWKYGNAAERLEYLQSQFGDEIQNEKDLDAARAEEFIEWLQAEQARPAAGGAE